MSKVVPLGKHPFAKQQKDALHVLQVYAGVSQGVSSVTDIDGWIVDLLVDLQHLCECRGLSLQKLQVKAFHEHLKEKKDGHHAPQSL